VLAQLDTKGKVLTWPIDVPNAAHLAAIVLARDINYCVGVDDVTLIYTQGKAATRRRQIPAAGVNC
jgi:hypothetical protein